MPIGNPSRKLNGNVFRIGLAAFSVCCVQSMPQCVFADVENGESSSSSSASSSAPANTTSPSPDSAEATPSTGGSSSEPTATAPPASSPRNQPPDGNSGMYGDNFKCSDGYNPDSDPSLHPPDQNAKVRMLINAQAQKEHEDRLAAQKQGSAEPMSAAEPNRTQTGLDKSGEGKPEAPASRDGTGKRNETTGRPDDNKTNEAEGRGLVKAPPAAASAAAVNPAREALYFIQLRKYADSLAILAPLVKKSNNNLDARYLLAVTYVGLRRYPEAIEQYKQIIALAPTSKQAILAADGLKKIDR